jgi:tetratricopeptide (TPR) repeat protein
VSKDWPSRAAPNEAGSKRVASNETVDTEADPTRREAEAEARLQEALETFFDPDVPPNEKQGKWTELAKAGLLDNVVAVLEENVEENADDPEAHAQLGHAYTQKIFTVSEVEKMRWAMQAHWSYDEAIQLDDHHWEARFSKAVSYSFAPPIFGLQPKAIEHFEVLRTQQVEQAPQKRFADTYELLGNMYQNSGNRTKAVEVWRQGANLYPDDNSLRDKVRALPGEGAAAAAE